MTLTDEERVARLVEIASLARSPLTAEDTAARNAEIDALLECPQPGCWTGTLAQARRMAITCAHCRRFMSAWAQHAAVLDPWAAGVSA